jgi:hypothetical protein
MDSTPLRRIGLSALAVTALGASFAAGAAWDDDGTSGRREVAAPQRLSVVPQGPGTLVPAGGCAELLEWYVDNTVDQVTPWGWSGGWGYYNGVDGDLLADGALPPMASLAEPGAVAAERSAVEQGSSETGTNVQEAGVDEPDVVKTNGELLVRIEGDDLTTYDVSGTQVRKLSTIDLPGTTDDSAELLLTGDEVVVLSQEAQRYAQQTMRTTVRRVDLSDPAEPEVLDEQSYDAALISARQYGDTVRLVLGTGLPALDFVQPSEKRTEREAQKQNEQIVRESEIEDWLPTVSEDDGDSELAVGCESMSRPEDFAGGGSVVVVGYDAGSPTERSSLGVATSSSIVYSSSDRIYLATSPMWATCCVVMDEMGWGSGRIAPDFAEDGVTSLHAFELAGTGATYVGSGEVEGVVRDRWAMDAVDGTLRVAVGASSQTGNFNSVVTLREQDGALEEIGRLDRLGVNEQIKSVRWFDDLAFVVTFRQTDPLYAIDLSDPAHPRQLAALKIPGFSEYLHPIGDDLMIGIGQDASMTGMTRGGQAAVFDISDLTDLRRVATHGYGRNRQTLAGSDPRQFTWLPESRTALTVVSEWGRDGGATGWVSVLEVGPNGALSARLLRGTYGYDDVAHLRTVPLPDGRVVLATENGARFLAW